MRVVLGAIVAMIYRRGQFLDPVISQTVDDEAEVGGMNMHV